MEVTVSKFDILSSYLTRFFNLGSSLITLPFILHMLSKEEVGMNYIMLSVGAFVQLADLGFCSQIGRNITYVLSGSNKISKYGIRKEDYNSDGTVNFHLLSIVITTAKFIYRRLSLVVLFLLLSLGSLYMYNVTDGFSNVKNSLAIWVLYSVSTYFNFYFLYYNSLLTGAGKIKENNFALVVSRVVYMLLCISLLYCGLGLMSVVISNIIAPFVLRYFSYHYFYSVNIKSELSKQNVDKIEINSALSKIWYTARKSATNMIGQYVGSNASTFMSGLYFSLSDTGQWGLMIQLYGIVSSFSMSMVMTQLPLFARYNLQGNIEGIKNKFSYGLAVFYLISIGGIVGINIFAPFILDIIGSNTKLPSQSNMWLYAISLIVLNNAQMFACVMTSKNIIPSPKAVLTTAFATICLFFIFLKYLNLGITGLILAPFIAGISYTLWRWPQIVLKDFGVNYIQLLHLGLKNSIKYIKK